MPSAAPDSQGILSPAYRHEARKTGQEVSQRGIRGTPFASPATQHPPSQQYSLYITGVNCDPERTQRSRLLFGRQEGTTRKCCNKLRIRSQLFVFARSRLFAALFGAGCLGRALGSHRMQPAQWVRGARAIFGRGVSARNPQLRVFCGAASRQPIPRSDKEDPHFLINFCGFPIVIFPSFSTKLSSGQDKLLALSDLLIVLLFNCK
jgi:hypothetical protein